MKFTVVLSLCLAQVLCVPTPQDGSFVSFFNKLSDKFADGVVEDVMKLRRITKKVKSRCYDDEKQKEAIIKCAGDQQELDPENIIKILQADSEEKKAAIIKREDRSDINNEGVKNMINQSVIIKDEEVKGKISEKVAECINLSQSCGLQTVEEKVKVLFNCLKPRMMAICVASQIKEKLGIDVEDDIGAL